MSNCSLTVWIYLSANQSSWDGCSYFRFFKVADGWDKEIGNYNNTYVITNKCISGVNSVYRDYTKLSMLDNDKNKRDLNPNL